MWARGGSNGCSYKARWPALSTVRTCALAPQSTKQQYCNAMKSLDRQRRLMSYQCRRRVNQRSMGQRGTERFGPQRQFSSSVIFARHKRPNDRHEPDISRTQRRDDEDEKASRVTEANEDKGGVDRNAKKHVKTIHPSSSPQGDFFSQYEGTVLESHLDDLPLAQSAGGPLTNASNLGQWKPQKKSANTVRDTEQDNHAFSDAEWQALAVEIPEEDPEGASNASDEALSFADILLRPKRSQNNVERSISTRARNVELLDLDYRAQLLLALERHEGDLVARCLLAAKRREDLDFAREISPETYTKILSLLAPNQFVKQLGVIHTDLSYAAVKSLYIVPMNQIASEQSQVLRHVMRFRLEASALLGLEDYKILLRGAGELGNWPLAVEAWDSLRESGLLPDTECFNMYMAANIANGMHNASTRHVIRTKTDYNMEMRRQQNRRFKFRNYRVGEGGLLATVRAIFELMTQEGGATPDEQSYRLLIIAAGREGRLGAVKSILREIWNINVDAILAGSSAGTDNVKKFPKDSPLQPTPDLLFAIAHAFSINPEVATALRVVDAVARAYQLPISTEVWGQLFESTFVLARNRTGTLKNNNIKEGELPRQSLLALWQTMTGAPYHVRPTMSMYNHMIKSLSLQADVPKMADMIVGGVDLYTRQRYNGWRAYMALKRAVAAQDMGKPTGQPLEILRQEYEYHDLIRRRNHAWLKRWTGLLFRTLEDWCRHDFKTRHWATSLPSLLWQCGEWAPTIVKYDTPTAVVEFVIRDEAYIARKAEMNRLRKVQRRAMLDKVPRYIGDRWLADSRFDGSAVEDRRQAAAASMSS